MLCTHKGVMEQYIEGNTLRRAQWLDGVTASWGGQVREPLVVTSCLAGIGSKSYRINVRSDVPCGNVTARSSRRSEVMC